MIRLITLAILLFAWILLRSAEQDYNDSHQ